MSVVDITSKAQFNDLIRDKPFVALQAHATWCGPCKAISPIFSNHAAKLGNDKYTFAKFDTDEVPDLAHELGIRSVPAFFFFEDEQKVNNVTGANPQALKNAVEELEQKSKNVSTSEDF